MQKKPSSPPSQSENLLGYPLMEKLIEAENFEKVNKTMSTCYDTLERMLKQKSGGLQKHKKIRQALQAYDLTIDLIRELLKVKYGMVKNAQKKGASPKAAIK